MRTEHYFESFDGTKIAYRLWGEDTGLTPLLCCSGIACNDVYWTYLAPELAAERLVVTWDYPYHGDSSAALDADAIGIDSLARHASAVLAEAGVKKAAITGHSMGVQVVLEMFRSNKEAAKALIPIAGPYGQTVSGLYGTNAGVYLLSFLERAARTQPDLTRRFWKVAANPALADPFGRLTGLIGHAPAELMRQYFDHVAQIDPLPLFEMFRKGQEHSAEEILEHIDVPVLILHGTADVMSPFSLAEEMKRRIPGAELVALENGGHTLPIEDPETINGEIRRFLQTKVDPV
ncbi:MAG TPA: alpha/beta hydrolase [Actinomycetota bacterium]|nr:alpha/beta hydrolase [Actinomycetota bacterium]